MNNADKWPLFTVGSAALSCALLTCLVLLYVENSRIAALEVEIEAKQQRLTELDDRLHRQTALREVERRGRIGLQQQQRHIAQQIFQQQGFNFRPIGFVESPFPDRRGTPRQPLLVPAAIGRIRFDKRIVQREHFEELSQFSHLWVIFVFHDNTNADKSISDGTGDVSRAGFSKNAPAIKAAKIRPPRLKGARVGCLSTRSPHRPNDIGLSVCEIVDVGKDYIELRCIDMVHGTPVLDVKPYIPYDVVPSMYNIPVGNGCSIAPLKVPGWVVAPEQTLQLPVTFSAAATASIEEEVWRHTLRHCRTSDEARALITQVLQQDIRGVHQGRGGTYNNETEGAVTTNDPNSTYLCRLDTLEILFTTLATGIHVVSATNCAMAADHY